jgi:probable F420-dependent oxidoreductase
MKFGVNILNFGPGATPAHLRQWARFAEDTGYHFIMISDHVASTPDVQAQYPGPFYDPFVALSWLAGHTHHVELGTSVAILPYRHPLQTSRITANLDQLSGGRFIFGVGVGWAKQEFQALGIPFRERGVIADESLAAIKTCWENNPAAYAGQTVSFENVDTAPSPRRKPHPPIWVGGASDAAMRRSVRYGDAWHPIRPRLSWLKEKGLPRLRQIADNHGIRIPSFCPRIQVVLSPSHLSDDQRTAGQGTLDQIRRDLHELAALEADYVLFDTYRGEPGTTADPNSHWSLLAFLAEKVVDLGSGSLR